MEKKIRVGILFGGTSTEHEVSLLSAQNIVTAIDRTRYEPILIGITKKGTWLLQDEKQYLTHANDPKTISLNARAPKITIPDQKLDVIFPVLHGTQGEDGTIQGMLELMNIPYVGARVLEDYPATNQYSKNNAVPSLKNGETVQCWRKWQNYN